MPNEIRNLPPKEKKKELIAKNITLDLHNEYVKIKRIKVFREMYRLKVNI